MDKKAHWENVYTTKLPHEVSWTQAMPKLSLQWIECYAQSKNSKIIDVGGGDSNLVDCLLERGFENITVLDISQAAIERAKERLGNKADKIHWICSDILDFQPSCKYDIWHDRATFHFLTSSSEIKKYLGLIENFVSEYWIIATFSTEGPKTCSGLEIVQYSDIAIASLVSHQFRICESKVEMHTTPFHTLQSFQYTCLKRLV